MLNYGPAVLILFQIFAGILLNRRDYSLLREDMSRRFAELKDDFNLRFDLVEKRFEQVDRQFEQVETVRASRTALVSHEGRSEAVFSEHRSH